MTEEEYIAATNLAKIRIAYRALSDVFLSPEIDQDDLKSVLTRIDQWGEALEKTVEDAMERRKNLEKSPGHPWPRVVANSSGPADPTVPTS